MDNQPENSRKPVVRAKNPSNLVSDLGKVPPQAIDLEQAVLGAMMLEKNAVTDTIDILKPSSFYDPKHQFIYGAIRDLFGSSNPIDLLTVTNRLKQKGELEAAGGAAYISQLTSRIASTANIEFHARLIAEKYMGKNVDLMQNVVRQAIEESEKASLNSDGISGIPTGFFELDKLTSGWQRSDMIVIAARPAMGKTAFVLSMARNTAVDYNMGVALFSLEMSSVQLVKRLIASEARLSAEKLRKGDLREHEFQQLHSRITKLATAPIYIDDTLGISVFDLRAKCRRLKMQHNIDIVIIDYLQLMTAGGSKGSGNREQEISTISRSIKEIAKELNVPVIARSQLSRSVEQRGGDKRPVLSDLSESGAIDQDAYIVSFIYRPEYYGFLQDEDGNSNQGVGEIIVAKHRNGALDRVRLRFIGEYARFDNIEGYSEDVNILTHTNLNVNTEFDSSAPQSYTIQSKMNSFDDDPADFDKSFQDETPF